MASFTEAGDEDDAAFLSAIAEAEADGLRRLSQDFKRIHESEPAESVSSSLPSSHGAGYGGYRDKEAAPKRSRVEPEGEYMAALRGTHSETWQAMSSKARPDAKPRYSAASSYSRPANLGFDGSAQGGGSDGSNMPGQAQVPQRNCPCGAGTCLVLTANTEKNPGRQFYKCPLRKEEGQCGFFEWCDGITSSSQGLSKEQGSSYTHSEFPCPCGAGPCIILTAKTEKNMGRQFYRCPLNQGEGSCGFFKWCDESVPASGATAPTYGGSAFGERTSMSNVATRMKEEGRCDGMTSSSQGVYKEQGSSYTHSEFPCPCGTGPCLILTAKTEKNMGRQFYRCPLNQGEGSCGFFKWCDESVPASGATAPAYGGSAFGVGSGTARTCFKCNQGGHWANSCPNQQFNHGSKGAVGGFNRQGGDNSFSRGFPNASGYGSLGTSRDVGASSCFKCGSEGHLSNNCPNASNTRQTSYGGYSQGAYGQASLSGRSGGSVSCYKCGGQGHQANDCRKGRNVY